MTYTLRIATEASRDLVIESLRGAARQRTRVAQKAAIDVAADKAAHKDVRTAAVQLTMILAEAGTLDAIAAELEAQPNVPVITIDNPNLTPEDAAATATRNALDLNRLALRSLPVEHPEHEVRLDVVGPLPTADDGTSIAAQQVAALAGLTPYDPDAPEDPVTGATPEDDPTDIAVAPIDDTTTDQEPTP